MTVDIKKMKNKYVLLLILITFLNISVYANINDGDVLLENEQFKLVIGNDAIAKNLILKSNGEECLAKDQKIALFSVTQERPYNNEIKLAHLNKRTTYQANKIRKEGDRLIVGFEIIPYEAVIDVKISKQYIRFSLVDFIVPPNAYPSYMKITPPPVIELTILQLPVKDRKNWGEWLNVIWDDVAAVNVLATDEFTQIDAEKRNGFHILKGIAMKDIKLKNTGVALIVCDSKKLLDQVALVEEDFNLPKGVASRRNSMINASYLWTDKINIKNVDTYTDYAKKFGFRCMLIYYSSFIRDAFSHQGDYEWNTNTYPNGKRDLEKVLQKIKKEGIIPGLHVLHSGIGRKSRYVSPVPDYRLNIVKSFNLSAGLNATDTVIYIDQNPEGLTMADGCRVLKAGTEFISYKGYTTTRPYKFTGCIRGVDRTTVNTLSKGYTIGLVDISEYGATSIYIDQRTSLQDEIAEKLGNIYNAGFQFVYFDGSEGVNPPFGYNVPLAQYKVFKRFDNAPYFAEGAAKSHFSWHILSGANAFDVFSPEYQKEAVRKHQMVEAPLMKADFTRINFGWIRYSLPSDKTIGTQPDILEFVTSKAAAWDSPISLFADIEAFKKHPRTVDNMEVIRRWEDVRAKNWLTSQQKKELQNKDQEFILLINEKKQYELVPCEQISDVANGCREVRAFLFKRDNEWYAVYWHISGNKRLALPLKQADMTLYKKLGEKERIISSDDHYVVIPVNDRKYLKFKNMTKSQVMDVFKNTKIID